jgi:hypothetical protein
MSMLSQPVMAAPPRLGRRLGPAPQLRHGRAVAHPLLHMRLVHGLLDGQFCELRYSSPATARHVSLLLRYATNGQDLVVLADMTDRDRWWRTFVRPYPVHVLLHRQWRQGLGCTAIRGQAAWREAAAIYTHRFPHITVQPADIFVTIALRADPAAGAAEGKRVTVTS